MTARIATLTPARRHGREILDDPGVDARVRERSMRDVALANRLFGGTRAVLRELRGTLRDHSGARLTMLDVGSGIGDIAASARRQATRYGVALETYAVDAAECLMRAGRARSGGRLVAVCGDALQLPFASASVDVVVASQLLHHFVDGDAQQVLGELDRVARRRVIVADLRRSWLAAAGIWAASFPLLFHPVSRHDGVLSVLRGFTPAELRDAVRAATGATAVVRRRRGFRVTAVWTPREALA